MKKSLLCLTVLLFAGQASAMIKDQLENRQAVIGQMEKILQKKTKKSVETVSIEHLVFFNRQPTGFTTEYEKDGEKIKLVVEAGKKKTLKFFKFLDDSMIEPLATKTEREKIIPQELNTAFKAAIKYMQKKKLSL